MQQTSSATIDRLASENRAMDIQLKHFTEVAQSAEVAEELLNKELDSLNETNVQLADRLITLQSSFDTVSTSHDALKTALVEKDGLIESLKSDTTILSNAAAGNIKEVEEMKLFVSDAEAKVKFAESAKGSVEQQRSEILRMKGGTLQFAIYCLFPLYAIYIDVCFRFAIRSAVEE